MMASSVTGVPCAHQIRHTRQQTSILCKGKFATTSVILGNATCGLPKGYVFPRSHLSSTCARAALYTADILWHELSILQAPNYTTNSQVFAFQPIQVRKSLSQNRAMGRMPVRCSKDSVGLHTEESVEQQEVDTWQPVVRAVQDVITATRITEGGDSVRVIGPGMDGLGRIGRILTFDEFFIAPNKGPLPFPEPGVPLESVVYYLEDTSPEEDESDDLQPRHGVQVHVESQIRIPPSMTSPLSPEGPGPFSSQLSIITHVRDAPFVPCVQLGEAARTPSQDTGPDALEDQSGSDRWRSREPVLSSEGSVEGQGQGRRKASIGPMGGGEGRRRPMGGVGGALVRVVAGACEDVKAPAPLDDGILLLDVTMRPGSTVELPIPSTYGALAYILEGVGFFGGSLNGSTTNAAYQNEGHALWLPPLCEAESPRSTLLVRSHQWSELRFILVGART